ncbi:MAG: hypothetical protein FWF97_00620 [Alphaproteobacteria bacterium]|nr:hypothetical protein [Alphaproteobacteria bacterium]
MKKNSFKKAKANLILYGGLALGVLVGGKFMTSCSSSKETQVEAKDFETYFKKIQPITPFLIAYIVGPEGVHKDTKTGLHIPYKDSNGIWTIGFGCTVLKDGKPVTSKTRPISDDEAYDLARWHIEQKETFFFMYCYDIAFETIDVSDVGQALGISSVIYNSGTNLIEDPKNKNHKERNTRLRNLYKEYGLGVPDSLVLQLFGKYPVVATRSFGEAWMKGASMKELGDCLGGFVKDGRGLYWRRWLEAGLLTGEITPEMLLECPVKGVYEFWMLKSGGSKKNFIETKNGKPRIVRATYKDFKEWLKNPVNKSGKSIAGWKRIKDLLPQDVVAYCQQGECKLGSTVVLNIEKWEKVEEGTYVINVDTADLSKFYDMAVAEFKKGNYKAAEKSFMELVEKYPDNALLRNDLAATYNMLGDHDAAVAQVHEIINRIGDKSQYGAAFYNLGYAREKKGNLQSAQANYRLAVANGNKKAQKDLERVTKQINQSLPTKGAPRGGKGGR